MHDFNLLEHLIVVLECAVNLALADYFHGHFDARVLVLGQNDQAESALAQRTQRLVLLDAVVRVEPLRPQNLAVPVRLRRCGREVDHSLLRGRADEDEAVRDLSLHRGRRVLTT